jgi:hypothetical protein
MAPEGVPTDCPQRDERLGWLGDAQVFARTACYNRDVAAFFAKWLDDVADAQHGSGAYPDIAPRLNIGWAGAPAWGDAGVIVPWTVWKMYGDTAVLDRHFGAMTRWMDFLERANPGYIRARSASGSTGSSSASTRNRAPPASASCYSARTPAGHWTGPAAPTSPSGAGSGPGGGGIRTGSRTGRNCRPTSRPPSASPAISPPRSATPRATRRGDRQLPRGQGCPGSRLRGRLGGARVLGPRP